MTQSVAELCQQKKMTVEELAEQAGMDHGRATAILLGRWTPSPQERQKIADVFNVEVPDITWGHKTPIHHINGHGPG